MRLYKQFLFMAFTALSQLAFGQGQDYVIPFQLTEYNNLSVQAILNGKDTVNLMFHTAANAVTLTEEAIKKLKSVRFAGTDSVKSWGGGGFPSRFSKHNSLQIGELSWQDVSIWENKNSGQQTDGKFGIDLFRNKLIELDFEKKVIVLHASLPAKIEQFEKLKLITDDDYMFIEATCTVGDARLRHKFLLHSGYSGAVLFDDTFVTENKLDEKLKIVAEKELQDSFGNVLKTKKAVLPTLTIGTEELVNVPAGFFKGALGRQKMSILGGDILKRFTILIDAKREYIYLKANSLKRLSYATI